MEFLKGAFMGRNSDGTADRRANRRCRRAARRAPAARSSSANAVQNRRSTSAMRGDPRGIVAAVDHDREDVELAVQHRHQVGEEAVGEPRQHAQAERQQRLGEGQPVGAVEFVDLRQDLAPLGRARAAGEIGDESRLQPVLRLIDVADRLRREIDDIEALVGPADQKTLAFELPRRLADRPAADAERLRHLRLVEPRARLANRRARSRASGVRARLPTAR